MALTRDKLFWDAFTSHADKTVRAAALLRQMLETPADAARLGAEITELEHQGDQITHDTITALHQTWITPLDREEIHSLMSKLDDVLDYIEAAAERIVLYEIDTATPEALELATVLSAAAEALARAVMALQNLKDGKAVLELCVEINRLENEADKVLRRGLGRLFRKPTAGSPRASGAPTDPMEVMKWRDVYETLESATDHAEDAANIIEGIVLEHA